MDLLPDWLEPEWRMIKKAPKSFVMSVVVIVSLLAFFIYQGLKVNLEMKNDLISSYEKEIERLKSPQESATERSASQTQKSEPGYLHLRAIYDKTFSNEEVMWDGFSYVRCKFDNVTFVTNGEAGQAIEAQILSQVAIKAFDRKILNVLELVHKLGLMNPTVKRISS